MTSSSLPADLLHTLRYVEEWQPPHSERNITKAVGILTPVDYSFTLPHDINSFAFSKYADVNLQDQQLGASRIPLRSPILAKQTATDTKESIEINRVIVQYLYESSLSTEKRQVFAAYVVQKGISSNDIIRDEIYVQLCSQSMGAQSMFNKAPVATSDAVWSLMAACLSSFPPSTGLAKYLLKYVSDNAPLGYDIICQHKLLQCLQHQQHQQHQQSKRQSLQQNYSEKSVRIARSYTPCLLEYKASASRACMALTGIFPNGDRGLGQVESWTTAEQFASHLLRQRNVVDPSNSYGWTVALRDEFDIYECSGNDFVMDLIGEIEVPPFFPSGTAYFLTTTDVLRSSMSSRNRPKWPSQPHNADRLRLMLLDVDESPDFYASASLPRTPESLSPTPIVSQSLVISRLRSRSPTQPVVAPVPVVAAAAPRQPPPAPAPTVRPEDVYASRDELMSQQSALNKRREPPVTDQLSKTSALNSRYVEVVSQAAADANPKGGNAASFQPPPPVARQRPVSMIESSPRPEVSYGSKLNNRYAINEPAESPALQYRRPTAAAPVKKQSVMQRPQAPPRMSSVQQPARPPPEVSMDSVIDSMFDIGDDDGAEMLQRRMKGGGDKNQPTGVSPVVSTGLIGFGSPYGVVPAPGLITSPQVVTSPLGIGTVVANPNLQLYQQQLYPGQLAQQQATDLKAALQAQELQNKLLEQTVQGELLKRQLQELQQQNGPQASGIDAAGARQTGVTGTTAKKPAPPTFSKPGGRPVVPVTSQKTVDNRISSGVTFAGDGFSPVPPPPPPQFGSTTVTNGISNGPSSISPLNITIPASAIVAVNGSSASTNSTDSTLSPSVQQQTSKVVIKAHAKASEKGTMRAPPKKIGQIVWPPPSSVEETDVVEPKPKPEIGRIRIEETKQEEVVIAPKLPPEEAQRRINDMIVAARLADAAGEVPKKKPVPPARPYKQSSQIQAETGPIDMKARQQTLEQQLTVAWRKKDQPTTSSPSSQSSPQLPVQPPPPVIPIVTSPQAPPPPPPPPASYAVPAVSPDVMPLSPQPTVANLLLSRPRPPVDYNDPPTPASPSVAFDVHSLDHKRTVLHAQITEPFLTYDHVSWALEIRKEVFSPAEKFDNASIMNVIFPQIVVDVLNEDCVRISKADRQKMISLLDKHGINARNAKANHSSAVKREIIVSARDLPIYFCRLFAVYGGKHNRKIQMVGVSHSGVRLLTRHKDQYQDYIEILNHIRFEELTEASVPRTSTVNIRTSNGQTHIFYTPRASQLCTMIETYQQEYKEVSANGGKPKPPENQQYVNSSYDSRNADRAEDTSFDFDESSQFAD